MSSATAEHVFSKTLLDFINEHDEIGYDIITELNRFDQFVTGRKYPSLAGIENLNEPDVNVQYLEESNIDRLLMEYADYSWNHRDQPTYTCKLCKTESATDDDQQQFTTLDHFLMHLRKSHVENIIEEQKQYSLDRQCEMLWVGELEKIKKLQYKHHSDEFMKELDEVGQFLCEH